MSSFTSSISQASAGPGPGLLYVVSSGRSGSTLFELMSATHPAVRTLGELQTAGHLIKSTTRQCGCGQPMATCPTWSSVAAEGCLERSPVPLTLVRESSGAGRVLRARWLPEVIRARRGPMSRRYSRGYAKGTRDLLECIARSEAADGRGQVGWYVDSSKDLYRLHLLASGGETDIRAVLVVRDPRGFVHAMAGTNVSRTIRMATRWTTQQVLASRVMRWLDPSGRIVIRYEDLAADPAAELVRLASILSVDPSGFRPETFRSVRDHAVAGNVMRHEPGPVELDDRWRRTSPFWQRSLTWFICRPVAVRFGYRWAQR